MNAYKVNYAVVRLVGEKGPNQTRSVSLGLVNVLADNASGAGDLAIAHVRSGIDLPAEELEVDIQSVHEVAKNVLIPVAEGVA